MNNCKGCKTVDCSHTAYLDDCPCIKCLVKVTCFMVCDELLNFRPYYNWNLEREIDKNYPKTIGIRKKR